MNWRSTFRWKWRIPRQILGPLRLLRCHGLILNWTEDWLLGGSGWFLVRFLVLLWDYWGVTVLWFRGVNGLIKHRWEDQYRFSRFIHWPLRVTVGLTLVLMVLMSQRLINNYPFWDLNINFMLKMLFILDNFARCWTNQWVNRKHNSFLIYCLSYGCHFRTQSKYDPNYSESEDRPANWTIVVVLLLCCGIALLSDFQNLMVV